MLFTNFLSYAPTQDKDAVRGVFYRLWDRYQESHRYYHTVAHLYSGLKVHSDLCPNTSLTPIEFFAWSYHDSVYDTTLSDNEQKSADVFMRDAPILGFSMEDIDQVTRLILATNVSEEPISIINDIDLSGLGSEPKVYDVYTEQIRKEYQWVEPEIWAKGRSAVLRQLLKRERLYITPEFNSKFLTQAIENMNRELLSL